MGLLVDGKWHETWYETGKNHSHFHNVRRQNCVILSPKMVVPVQAARVDFDHIKTHYYISHPMINPNQIVPIGPDIDYQQPHNRPNVELPAK